MTVGEESEERQLERVPLADDGPLDLVQHEARELPHTVELECHSESLQRDDWALFKEWTRNHSELPHWIADLARPGALTAALNWYRANMNPARPGLAGVTFPPVKVPTLGLWSSGDAYLLETQMQGSSRFCSGEWRYERIEDASHWMQLDQPARVNSIR